MNQPNEFEELARIQKVIALSRQIDDEAREAGLNPLGGAEEIAAVKERVEAYTPDDWKRLARAANRKKPPSQATIDLVISAYQQRLDDTQIDPFARF